MVHLAYLMLLLPLAGFLFLLTFGRRIGDPVAGWIGTAAVGGSFVVACFVLAGLLGYFALRDRAKFEAAPKSEMVEDPQLQ